MGSDDKLRQLAATAACARLVLAWVAHCREVTHSVHVTAMGTERTRAFVGSLLFIIYPRQRA